MSNVKIKNTLSFYQPLPEEDQHILTGPFREVFMSLSSNLALSFNLEFYAGWTRSCA